MHKYETALVLGLGVSGEAAARLLAGEGCAVAAVDSSSNPILEERAERLRGCGANVRLGIGELPKGLFDVCIVSPGIPSSSSWVREIEGRGMKVISELELGASRCRCPMLAVTGSKGKSTLVKLCCDILAESGMRSAVSGNYGTPLCETAAETGNMDWVVVEVSSFQLEKVEDFHPRAGILLNVQPDHLDRHGSMEEYRRMKCRIFSKMSAGDTGIVAAEDLSTVRNISTGGNTWLTFGTAEGSACSYSSGEIKFNKGGKSGAIDIRSTYFDNKILGAAASAAAAAAVVCGAGAESVEKAIKKFKPLPHRMTQVRELKRVCFIDDSKATSITALSAGVEMAGGPVRLIAGGLLKEKDLIIAKKTLEKKVRRVYLIGLASKDMEAAWGSFVDCLPCGTLENAVNAAWKDAESGDAVLLSPGCASFDQFRNYGERGDQFVGFVNKLK